MLTNAGARATTPTRIPHAGTRPLRPHLDLPPGLAGGAGQHRGQVDAAHGTSENLWDKNLTLTRTRSSQSSRRFPRARFYLARAGQSGAGATVPRSITAQPRSRREISLRPRPLVGAPGSSPRGRAGGQGLRGGAWLEPSASTRGFRVSGCRQRGGCAPPVRVARPRLPGRRCLKR